MLYGVKLLSVVCCAWKVSLRVITVCQLLVYYLMCTGSMPYELLC